tara:strand:+ start:4224 stop:5090 length:867 start_codon:yes stop_codon:yes gene_type:complete
MIQSMTGFGKSRVELSSSIINVEIRSLNSKYFDLSAKIPTAFKEKELELKRFLNEKLARGKIEILIQSEPLSTPFKYSVNTQKVKDYHEEIKQLSEELKLSNSHTLSTILKMPDSLIKEEQKIDEEKWSEIFEAVKEAVKSLTKSRDVEGSNLEKDLLKRIENIEIYLKEIIPFSSQRIEKVKENLRNKIEQASLDLDSNRLEQELIYYLEKQDINEEIVRLESHLAYFLSTLKISEPKGKKLGFICQEIGREINTIGSKSSDAEMQKVIINMKDELEKIKEQLLNIL